LGYVNFSSIRSNLDCAISELRQIESGKYPIESGKTELKQGGRLELLELSIDTSISSSATRLLIHLELYPNLNLKTADE
jgi:hypothetical protein